MFQYGLWIERKHWTKSNGKTYGKPSANMGCLITLHPFRNVFLTPTRGGLKTAILVVFLLISEEEGDRDVYWLRVCSRLVLPLDVGNRRLAMPVSICLMVPAHSWTKDLPSSSSYLKMGKNTLNGQYVWPTWGYIWRLQQQKFRWLSDNVRAKYRFETDKESNS